MLLTPLPGLVLIVFVDVLPMNPPEDGVLHQSLSYHVRTFGGGWLIAHMVLMQLHASSPTLPLSPARLWAISLATGSATYLSAIALGYFVAFPTPFSICATIFLWLLTFASTIWMTWKDVLAANPDAKRKVLHYALIVFSAQSAMFFVYSGYTIAFNRIPTSYQTWFTFLLPVIKLAFKNWVIKGVVYVQDLAPTIIVFNVDVFHATFVSTMTQDASSWGSVAVVMAIDLAQAATAYYEVSKVLAKANKSAMQSLTKAGCDADADTGTAVRRTPSQRKLELGVIDYALDVIDSNPRICGHQDVALPRYRRVSQLQSAHLVPVRTLGSPPLRVHKSSEVTAPISRASGPRIVPARPGPRQDSATFSPQFELDSTEKAQLACVKSVLKMLYMIEFYVLIEFAEAIVPLINAVYMHVLVYLPTRVYYWSLASLTQDELRAKADRMAIYASLELLSLVVFCCMMDRKLRHTSTYQILAFVLRKHARMSQTSLTMWIFFIVQLGLRHFDAKIGLVHQEPPRRLGNSMDSLVDGCVEVVARELLVGARDPQNGETLVETLVEQIALLPLTIGQQLAVCIQDHAWKRRTLSGGDAEHDAWTCAEQLLWMTLVDQQWLVDWRVAVVPPQLLSTKVSWSKLPLQLLDCSCLSNRLVSAKAAALIRETLSLDALLTLNLSSWEDQVSDELLETLALRCQRLEDVDVSHCSQLTDKGLSALIDANVSTLQRLNVSGLRHLTGEVSIGNIEKCSRLHTLELDDCMSLVRLPNLSAEIPSATALNIQGLSQFTDDQFSEALTSIFPRLRCLHLGESELSGASLQRLVSAARTTSLREVDLSWCSQIDNDAIAELVRRSPELRVLKLRCTHVDDKALEWIGCRSASLTALDLERCDGLTRSGFESLVASALRTSVGFQCLETINLSWTSVPVVALGRLLEQCAETITSIRIQGCRELHSGLLDAMLASRSQWPRLQLLDCSWINDIADDKLQTFRDAVRNAEVIGYYGTDD